MWLNLDERGKPRLHIQAGLSLAKLSWLPKRFQGLSANGAVDRETE